MSARYRLARAGLWIPRGPLSIPQPRGGLGVRTAFARLLQRDGEDAAPSRPLQPAAQARLRGAADDPFTAFVAAHEGPLFAYLWRMTGDEAVAYDLRQETFIRAWRAYDRLRDYDRPAAWLYRVATNLALNYRRDQSSHIALAGATGAVGDPAASDPSGRLVERDLVRATLLALPTRERAALALREGQGLACDEVAAALGVTPAAARTLLWRARERFRDLYLRADPTIASRWSRNNGGGQGGAQ